MNTITNALKDNEFTDKVNIKKAEEALQKSEERMRAVLDNVIDGIITINEHGIIESFNLAAKHIFGYQAEEVIGKNVHILMPEPHQSEHDRYISNYLTTGVAKVIGIGREVEGRKKDGSIFPMELALSEAQIGDKKFFTSIVRDITERKKAEERQTQLLNQLNVIISSVGDAIVVTDKYLKITTVNPAFVELIEKNEIIGEHCADVLNCMNEKGEVICDSECGLKQTLNKGINTVSKTIIKNSEGKEITIQSINSPLKNADGEIIGAVKAIRDISKEAEVDRMKSEFISTVSHELRTPLTSIKGYIDLILDGDTGEINELQKEFLGIVSQNSDRLNNLINDLLDVEKIESGKIEMKFEKVSLSNLVNLALSTMESTVEKKGLKLISKIEEGIELYGDSDRIIQVLINFISNAVKFTKEGEITVELKLINGKSEIVIQDTGIGISKSDQKKLFTKFFRADDEYTRSVGGTGLGLSIVKSIVKKHGGEIEVKSELNKGSEFRVIFPIKKQRGKRSATE